MASPRKLKAAARAGRSEDQKGPWWDKYFQNVFPNRAVRDEARDRDGIVVYRPTHLGLLQAPQHAQYEVCWKQGDTYDTATADIFSWQQLQPMLKDRFIATHFQPAMITHLVLPLQERNWHATDEEYTQMTTACMAAEQRWQELTKEKNRQLAHISGERAAAAEGQQQAAKKPRKPAAAAAKNAAAAAPAAAAASKAAKAKGKPAAAAAAGSKAAAAKPAKAAPAAATAKPAKAAPAAAAAAAGKSTAKAGSSSAAAAGAKKRPAAALALSAKRQKTGAAAAAAAAQDDDEAAAAAAESSEEEPSSESEEQQQSDDDSDSEPSSSDDFKERRPKPLRVQQPRGQQQQQQRKGRQAAAAAAAAAPPSASKNTKKEQQQQQQQQKKQAAVKQEPAGKRSKPDAAAAAAAAAEMTYKGHTGRSYPASVACKPKDKRIGTRAYAAGEASGEYPVAWIVDEVSYMLPGSTKKQHKVLPKWEGYELDVNGWEDAAGMAELDCYKEWQGEDKPAYYTAVKPAAAANAFIAWKQTGKSA
ncbi:hypothetical protein OEZ86_003595 [Tetradesmus obliquus]|nr:hypothetical protein OEZ86_003595 [Tetradesmus obliquus]